MSNNKEINKHKKVNRIYSQCFTYAVIACALSASWILSAQVHNHTHHKKSKYDKTKLVKLAQNPIIPPKRIEPLLAPELHSTVVVAPIVAATPIITATPSKAAAPIKVANNPLEATLTAQTTKAPQQNKGISITQTKIDNNFLAKLEGTKLKAYVPAVKKSKSGVTVGTGFDLGQMHAAEFKQLPLNASLKAKLAPYVGLKQNKALAFLKAHPLSITPKELEEVDEIAANKILKPLAAMYAKSSGKSFTSLPSEAQTVIFSYAYQHGPGFMTKGSTAKKLWHYFVAENWQKASQALKRSKLYATRRVQEAKLLDKLA